MPAESDVQATRGTTKNKYFCGSVWGYVSTEEYTNMSKAHQQAVYRLCNELDGSSSPAAIVGTSKEYANLKRQVSAFYKKADESFKMEEPSGD